MLDKSLRHSTIESFLAQLGSTSPTPGGSSAAAVVAAIGAGLLEMTARVSADSKDAGDAKPELLSLAENARALGGQIVELADRDVGAYDGVTGAFRLPKLTEIEQRERRDVIQRALILATEVPFAIADLCLGVLHLAVRAIEIGSVNIVGDAAVGAHAATAALHGVLINVDQNLRSISDVEYVRASAERARGLKCDASDALSTALDRLRERGIGS